MADYKPLWVRPETHHQVKIQAAKAGLTVVDFVEVAILEALVKEEADETRARRLTDASETYSVPEAK